MQIDTIILVCTICFPFSLYLCTCDLDYIQNSIEFSFSFTAVRYGRVPKRSREKNEDNQVTQSETELPSQNYEYKQMMYDIILSVSEAHRANCAYTEEKTRGLVRKPALFVSFLLNLIFCNCFQNFNISC